MSQSIRRLPIEGVFHPSRLTLARMYRGMSKAELGAVTGLSANSLSSYENAKATPRPETVQTLAKGTDFPVSFFYSGEAPLVDPKTVSFRGLARMPADQRNRVTAAAGLAIGLDRWIGERFDRPAPNLPHLPGIGPVEAAEMTRSEWGLGQEPIPNLIHLVEQRGVRVFSLAPVGETHHLGAIDALSMWWGDTPFVFLNTTATVERMRHSLAHELAHLILHRDGGPTGQRAEKEANSFAGHFLLPSSGLRAEARRYSALDEILTWKRKWTVSALAYVFRMNEEGLLDDWRYKELCVRLRRDYGPMEPDPDGAVERSQALRKVFSSLKADGGRTAVARDLNINVSDLDALVFSHVLTPLPGGNPEVKPGARPNLRVLD